MGFDIGLRIDVFLHNDTAPGAPDFQVTLQRIEAKLSDLSDAISAAVARVGAVFAALTAKLDEALGNDAADAAEKARLQAEIDSLKAEAQSAIAELANLAPDPAEPPVDPDDVPVGDPPVGDENEPGNV